MLLISALPLHISFPPSLPDDTEYSVFDYYVDESGEWDVWQSRYCTAAVIMGKVMQVCGVFLIHDYFIQ